MSARKPELFLCGGDYLHLAHEGCKDCKAVSPDEARRFLKDKLERETGGAVGRYNRAMHGLGLELTDDIDTSSNEEGDDAFEEEEPD